MLTREMREQLLSVSTSGKNEAAKGFMGKIREMIFTQMLPSSGIKASSFRDGGRTSSSDLYTYNDICEWSMNQYKSDVSIRRFGDTDAEEAWDELEKSIVARLADDVKVSMNGISVEITIYKSFPD